MLPNARGFTENPNKHIKKAVSRIKSVIINLFSVDGAYASNSQPDPDFRQAVGPTAHHYPGLLLIL